MLKQASMCRVRISGPPSACMGLGRLGLIVTQALKNLRTHLFFTNFVTEIIIRSPKKVGSSGSDGLPGPQRVDRLAPPQTQSPKP